LQPPQLPGAYRNTACTQRRGISTPDARLVIVRSWTVSASQTNPAAANSSFRPACGGWFWGWVSHLESRQRNKVH
jgi:hypothetical protein